MTLTENEATSYTRSWGLPLRLDQGRFTVRLGDELPHSGGAQLCAWTLPEEIGWAAVRRLDAGHSRPAVFRPGGNRMVILGMLIGWLSNTTAAEIEARGVEFHDEGELILPDPGQSAWVTYSTPGTRLPSIARMLHAIAQVSS